MEQKINEFEKMDDKNSLNQSESFLKQLLVFSLQQSVLVLNQMEHLNANQGQFLSKIKNKLQEMSVSIV